MGFRAAAMASALRSGLSRASHNRLARPRLWGLKLASSKFRCIPVMDDFGETDAALEANEPQALGFAQRDCSKRFCLARPSPGKGCR
eukprot:scaffold1913_cov257-Pinguiococcus_pyrenoidosus.AAC.16